MTRGTSTAEFDGPRFEQLEDRLLLSYAGSLDSISPVTTPISLGESLNYTVNVTNTGTSRWGSSSVPGWTVYIYNLSWNPPAGWHSRQSYIWDRVYAGNSDSSVQTLNAVNELPTAGGNYSFELDAYCYSSTGTGYPLANAPLTVYFSIQVPNSPPTDESLSGNSVAENQGVGTAVGTLSTTDPDAGNTFTYSLVAGTGSTDNASFSISGSTLQTAAVFNHEAKSSYTVRIRTADQGGLSYEEAFGVTVTNVNEQPTGIALSSNSVGENNPVGTVVGVLSGTDPDAGHSATLTFSLVGGYGDNALFSIDPATKQLRTAAVIDYETRTSCDVRVRAADSGSPGLTYDESFTIVVTNANDQVGDANEDGKVDGGDLALWEQNYDPLGLHQNTWGMGDWNGDGRINGADRALWRQNYNPLGLTAVAQEEPLLETAETNKSAAADEPVVTLGASAPVELIFSTPTGETAEVITPSAAVLLSAAAPALVEEDASNIYAPASDWLGATSVESSVAVVAIVPRGPGMTSIPEIQKSPGSIGPITPAIPSKGFRAARALPPVPALFDDLVPGLTVPLVA